MFLCHGFCIRGYLLTHKWGIRPNAFWGMASRPNHSQNLSMVALKLEYERLGNTMKYDEISELSPVMKAFLGVFQCTSGIFRDNPNRQEVVRIQQEQYQMYQFLSHQLMEDDFSGKNLGSSSNIIWEGALDCDEDLKALRQACGQEKVGTPRVLALIFGPVESVELWKVIIAVAIGAPQLSTIMLSMATPTEEEMETSEILPSHGSEGKVSHWLSRVRASFIVPAVGLMVLGVFALGAMRQSLASPTAGDQSEILQQEFKIPELPANPIDELKAEIKKPVTVFKSKWGINDLRPNQITLCVTNLNIGLWKIVQLGAVITQMVANCPAGFNSIDKNAISILLRSYLLLLVRWPSSPAPPSYVQAKQTQMHAAQYFWHWPSGIWRSFLQLESDFTFLP